MMRVEFDPESCVCSPSRGYCAQLLFACALCFGMQGDGWTPLRIARSRGHAAVIAFLTAASGR